VQSEGAMNQPSGPDAGQIQKLFASISTRYDFANRVLSLGFDQWWRRRLIRGCLERTPSPREVLDLACGTGDVASALQKMTDSVTGGDLSKEMLEQAKAKNPHVRWIELDATRLPFENQTSDLITIAFGLRNVSDPATAIREMYRVLRPGGVIGILEFGNPGNSILGRMIQLINRAWLKTLGGKITGHPWAYQYLSKSSENFPGPTELEALATQAISEAAPPELLSRPKITSRRLFPGICYTLFIFKPHSAATDLHKSY
jgi:demethylmenaquinone methyltransferase/2-methoxy-6-polyprenyl-1,4-benzoquinol methylase